MRFSGRTMVVTGASEGIGFAVSQALAEDGAHVVMLARRAEFLEAAAARLREAGGACEAIAVDVADADAFAGAIKGVFERAGRLDGLVNNAAYTFQGTLLQTPTAKWRRMFEINVEAPFVGMCAALEVMQGQGSGAIVNISSVSGVRVRKGGAAYSVSKAALNHLSAVGAIEAAEYGVRVNTVIPGATLSEKFKRNYPGAQEGVPLTPPPGAIPLGRFGEPRDVASAVAFLLSDEAAFITGETLRVEGGAYWTR